jgi:hypothetical protein
VIAKNPDNVQAKAVKGYAEIKTGDLDAAETIFQGGGRQLRRRGGGWQGRAQRRL